MRYGISSTCRGETLPGVTFRKEAEGAKSLIRLGHADFDATKRRVLEKTFVARVGVGFQVQDRWGVKREGWFGVCMWIV